MGIEDMDVGANVAVGMAGVELGGRGLGVEVAVATCVDAGTDPEQAANEIARMIAKMNFSVCLIIPSTKTNCMNTL